MSAKSTMKQSPETQAATEAAKLIHENSVMREHMSAILQQIRFEDEGWETIFGPSVAGEYGGLQLEDLKAQSRRIRESMIKSPIMQRGANLRTSYVWSKGINLPNLKPDDYGKKPGAKTREAKRYDAFRQEINQRYVFSAGAKEEMERALYSDGNFFLLGDSVTQTLRRVPLDEIDGFMRNPDFAEEVWAWKRTWTQQDSEGKSKSVSRWYYTDDCPIPRNERVNSIGKTPVDHDKELLVMSANRLVGWPLGVPDAISVLSWAKLYSDFLKHGYVMSRALASIAFKATSASPDGTKKAAARMSRNAGAGQTAIMGQANELTAMPTAGRGYDFGSGRPLAAQVATGVQVSIVHLLSDPGAAGSSYGSASNLDLPTKRAVVSRQEAWKSFFERILRWFGVADPIVNFPTLEEPDFYREVQALVLGWQTGNIQPGEMRLRLMDLLDIVSDDKGSVPGVIIPNNSANVEPASAGAPGPSSTAAPDQGRSNGAGRGGVNDLRDDAVGEALSALRGISDRDEMRALLLEALERIDDKA